MTLFTIAFSSCSDDDDDVFVNSSNTLPTNLVFKDTNLKEGEISGELSWTKPTDVKELSALVIYTSDDGNNKKNNLGEVKPENVNFSIENKAYAQYLLIVPKNINGLEGNSFAKIKIEDAVGSSVPTNVIFEDTNSAKGKISGELIWVKPIGYANASAIVIYGSSDGVKRDVKIGQVEPTVEKYMIDNLDAVNFFVLVAKDLSGKEIEEYTSITVNDYVKFGLFILNSGKMGSNNASLMMYNPETKKVENYFEKINGKKLGDTAQDIIIYGSKTYVAVYGSKLIYVLDQSGKIIGTIKSQNNGQDQAPRSLTSYEGKVYATLYDGYLAKIDTTSLTVTDKVQVGRSPEYVRASNNKLYVANSGGMDFPNYDKTVSVVDVKTFKKEKDIEVVLNPDKMAVDSNGNIYVISNGDYKNVPNTLQKIDATTQAVTKIGNATWMTMANDQLYTIYSQYDANWQQTVSYSVMDTKTGQVKNIITDGTKVEKPYSISVEPSSGRVYISTSDYKTAGDMYEFSASGKLINKFSTEGLNPIGAYSFYK